MFNTTKNRTLFFLSVFALSLQSLSSAPLNPTQPPAAEPCALLIGLETYPDCEGELGAFVGGVIEGSLAAQWGFKPGDIIVSMDKYAVDTPDDLLMAKSHYQPGDKFTLQYLRNGQLYTAYLQFPTCADPVQDRQGLSMSVAVVPNPSQGQFQLVLDGTQGTVQVQITTVEGQVVYQNSLPAGFSKTTVELGQQAGVYFLTAVQGDQVVSRKIVVTPL